MSWWHPEKFSQKQHILFQRAAIIKAIRMFFDDQNYLEVETPALQICPVMDAHIHGFKTTLKTVDRSHRRDMYLHTSPEFDMKKLLVAGLPKIYQVCHVFRNAEGSTRHSPEFTLLEWYHTHKDYTDIMNECEDLIRTICARLSIQSLSYQEMRCDPFQDWERLSVVNAFKDFADIDLEQYLDDRDGFALAAKSIGIRVIDDDHWDDIFHAIMAEKIEPFLGQGAPTILYDYPVSMAALSRPKQSDNRFAERFELYICSMELANAFSELTDAKEQRDRYHEEMILKQKIYGETYPPDEEFFKALTHGMPQSAGIALGVDRLVMLMCGAENISDVLWAPVQMNSN